MTSTILRSLVCLSTLLVASAWPQVKVGAAAPDFTAIDNRGVERSLADFRGKYVVLEWHSPDCPFARKHYHSGNMQKLQEEWTAKNVVWLAVLSTRTGVSGYLSPEQSQVYMERQKAKPTAVLMDSAGKLGHLNGAKTALHMVIIAPDGKVIYQGAIDDRPTPDEEDIPSAHNYVDAALREAAAGKQVTTSAVRPYGCTIQYAAGSE